MSGDYNAGGATITSAGSRQQERSAVTSSAVSGPFAEAREEVEQGAVRSFFGAGSPEGARGGTGAAAASSALPTQFAEVSESAEQGAVRPLMGASSPEPALTGTGFSYRHNWGPRRGQLTLRLNWSAVNARSRVLVSIGEGAGGGPDAGKFIGAARYTLHNVAPRAGGVDIWVNVEWSADILLYVDYLVINP
ncbi:MAG: hypothetical protein AB1941_01995 [Gemmatimonadota bacterium]